MNKIKARVIAFYLPQFHPTPENDVWWGKGFTEWTNVGKAKPLFRGHYQPKVPADLGYYDLRLPEIREEQVKLAKEACIYGFCYWHYWFGEGKRLLEMPFNEVLKSGKPNFPFCLGWANESWENKLWDADNFQHNKILVEQKYPGKADNEIHFYSLLNAFKDLRYIRIYDKPLFLIYKPENFQDIKIFIAQWNQLARENGISGGFHFVAHASSGKEYSKLLELGFNSVEIYPMNRVFDYYYNSKSILFKSFNKIDSILKKALACKKIKIIEYKDAIKILIDKSEDSLPHAIPTIMPNWDHSPRSGNNAWILNNSSPELFKLHVKDALECIENKPEEEKIIFLKSWNEWAEGNYMEPDIKFGKGYIYALKEVISGSNE